MLINNIRLFFRKYDSVFKIKNYATSSKERKNKDVSYMIYHSLYTDFTSSVSVSSCFLLFFLLSNTFFLQRFLLQLLLPTFEVTSRPFRPSVISRCIGGSKLGGTFLLARGRERKSPRAFESSGTCTSTSYKAYRMRKIKCRMTNAAPRARNPPKFRDYN